MGFVMRIWIIISLVFFLQHVVQAGWDKLNSGSKQTFYGISALDSMNACAVGWVSVNDAAIYLTKDGGKSWTKQPVENAYLFGVKMLDANNVIVTGYSGNCSCGLMYYTANAGVTWDSSYFDANSGAYSFGFYTYQTLNATTALTSGYGGVIAKTTTGGESWYATQTNTGTDVFRVLTVADSKTLYAASGDNGNFFVIDAIYRSTDAGDNWTQILPHNQLYSIGALSFINASTGLMFGSYNGVEAIRKTVDSGATWKTVWSSKKAATLQSGTMLNASIGYAVGMGGRVLRTTDGGDTWTEENNGTQTDLLALSLVNENIAFAAGASGVILKRKEGNSTSAITDEEYATHTFQASLQPLPATGVLHVVLQSAAEEPCLLRLYDANGKEQRTIHALLNAGENKLSLDVSSLSQGIYTVHLSTATLQKTLLCPLIR